MKVIKLAVIMSFIMITASCTYADELKSLENQTLQELATIIRQKDEALTRAVNYYVHLSSMSGYEKNLKLLEKALELAASKGDSKDKSILKQVEVANNVLVKIEDKAVALAKAGKQKEAIQLMEGVEYQEGKNKYSDALDSFYKKYGVYTGETESLESLQNQTLIELAVIIRQKDMELTQAVKDYVYVSPTANDDHVSPISDYEKNLELLEKAIELAVSKGDSEDKAILKQIEHENNTLATIEEKAIALAKAGKHRKAIKLLEGTKYSRRGKQTAYWKSKERYSQALDAFYKKYGVYTGTIESIASLENQTLIELAVIIRQKDRELTQAVKDYVYISPMADYDYDLKVLTRAIELAISKGDRHDERIFRRVEMANNVLVKIEDKAIALVKADKQAEAVQLMKIESFLMPITHKKLVW